MEWNGGVKKRNGIRVRGDGTFQIIQRVNEMEKEEEKGKKRKDFSSIFNPFSRLISSPHLCLFLLLHSCMEILISCNFYERLQWELRMEMLSLSVSELQAQQMKGRWQQRRGFFHFNFLCLWVSLHFNINWLLTRETSREEWLQWDFLSLLRITRLRRFFPTAAAKFVTSNGFSTCARFRLVLSSP